MQADFHKSGQSEKNAQQAGAGGKPEQPSFLGKRRNAKHGNGNGEQGIGHPRVVALPICSDLFHFRFPGCIHAHPAD